MNGESGGDGGLWEWAVAAYARPGAKNALLELQHGAGADVVLILWRLWLAERGRRPTADALHEAIALSGDWRAGVVAPLRAARGALKTPIDHVDETGAATLRRRVLEVELAAEKLQLEALAGLDTRPDPASGAPPSVAAALAEIPPFDADRGIDLSTLSKALTTR